MKSFNVQHPTVSSVLPFDIIALIIDAIGENKDMDLLKELALVSHSFLQICNKHLFATVELHDAVPMWRASSKKGFVKLLKNRPHVVKYIRKLTYDVSRDNRFHRHVEYVPVKDDDHLLSPILPNFLQTISQLNCLVINASKLDWSTLDSSLISALLHLMHLPTINHIDLSFIENFPLSILTPCLNLHLLDICYVESREEDGFPEIIESEMPRIHQFHTSSSSPLVRKLLHAKRPDGQPAFDFRDLKQISMSFTRSEDEQNIRYLLQHAKLLEKLHLDVERSRRSLVGLHDILSPTARTLKALELTVPLCDSDDLDPAPLAGLCQALETMAGHNMLAALTFQVNVDGYETEDVIGFIIQKVEKVLVKPGWSALKQVSFNISIACCLVSREISAKLSEALQSLPDKYLSHLSKLDSIAFNYSASVVKCAYELD